MSNNKAIETCVRCSSAFKPYEHNPHTLCIDCVERLEAAAHFSNEIAEIRMGRLPDEHRLSYETELLALPGSARRRWQTGE